MKCDKVRDIIITDYMDGRLTGAAALNIENHLAECRECREYHKTMLKKTSELFEGLEPMDPPQEVWEAISGKLYKKKERSIGIRDILVSLIPPRRIVLAAVSAGLVFVLLSGVNVWRIYDRGLTQKYMEMQLNYFTDKDTEHENDAAFGSVIEDIFM
ncbi:MAG: zf-HC2 domain-containing protein [Candidatus Omnitrophica bacterium]|nr:zf-HC2 domain-containing protein [Candidatus Omnitrophota bacterium]